MSYDAYGRAWHRRPSDVRGDGVFDATYVNNRFAAAACATIGNAGYDPDLDLNRDGAVCDTAGNPDVALV